MHKAYAYGHRRQRTLFVLELATLALSVSVEVIMALTELPLGEATGCHNRQCIALYFYPSYTIFDTFVSASQCNHVVCFMRTHRRLYVTWLKSTFGVLSLLGSLLFLILLNVHRNTATVVRLEQTSICSLGML